MNKYTKENIQFAAVIGAAMLAFSLIAASGEAKAEALYPDDAFDYPDDAAAHYTAANMRAHEACKVAAPREYNACYLHHMKLEGYPDAIVAIPQQ